MATTTLAGIPAEQHMVCVGGPLDGQWRWATPGSDLHGATSVIDDDNEPQPVDYVYRPTALPSNLAPMVHETEGFALVYLGTQAEFEEVQKSRRGKR